MDWSQSTLQPDFLMGVFWGYYRTPESQRDWPAIRKSLAQKMITELRRKVQAHIGRLPVSFYDANKTGVLVSRIMSEATLGHPLRQRPPRRRQTPNSRAPCELG